MKVSSGKNLEEIAARIRAFRLIIEPNQGKAAAKFDIAYSTYKRYENGTSEPGSEAIAGMVRSGLNANWLMTGEGEMLQGYSLGHASVRFEAHEPHHLPYGFILVPRYDVAASMGNGSVIHSEQVVDNLAFREEWVRTELGANPKNLILISAIGDSMEPTLRAGDLLLVDRNNDGVKQDAIYAFATNDELRVKRMQLKIDGSVVVKSDNPQYESETLSLEQAHSLRIIGRVVWSGRRM